MKDPTDPICIEQSLWALKTKLGLFDEYEYSKHLNYLADKGRIRYTDNRFIESILTSPDGQFLCSIIFESTVYSTRGKSMIILRVNKLYPGEPHLLIKEEFPTFSKAVNYLNDNLQQYNLRQRKKTLNTYDNEISIKLKKGFAIGP